MWWHAQKTDFVLRRNGQVHLNRRGRQFSRLLAGELRTSACRVCTARASLCSAVMWRLLVTHSILLLSLHFSTHASPCAITFQPDSTAGTYKMPLSLRNSPSSQIVSTSGETPKAQAVVTIWSSSIYKKETYSNFKNVKIKHSLFWDVAQCILAVADVSGQPTVLSSRVKGPPMEVRQIGSP